jgi:hypothetical protein
MCDPDDRTSSGSRSFKMSDDMLQRGDRISHFDVTTVGGERISYTAIWQQQHLLLLILPSTPADDEPSYLKALNLEMPKFHDVACVVSRDAFAGMRGPGVVVADRWGEVIYAAGAESVGQLPRVEELVEWLEYVRNKCPECEGEAK